MANIISIQNESKQERQARLVRVIIGTFVGIVFLSLVGYGVWQLTSSKQVTSAPKTTKQVIQDLSVKNYELNAKGDYEGATSAYSEAANNASSVDTKQQIYLQQATMSLNAGKLDDALAAAKSAEMAKPGLAVSQMIAIIAEKKDDKELAVSYLKRAITQLDTNAPLYQVNLDQMKKKITALGGQL